MSNAQVLDGFARARRPLVTHWQGYDRYGTERHKVACGARRGATTQVIFDNPAAVSCRRCIYYLEGEGLL